MAQLKYDTARDELIDFVPQFARRLVDVGRGVGRFAEKLRSARPNLEIWGVEPDHGSARIARSFVDTMIEQSFAQALDKLPTGAFDVVTFNDVLEHLVDQREALDASRALLAPGGAVIASIPNVRHRSVVWPLLAHGRWDYADTGPLDRTHLRFFTRESMRRLFIDAGWQVESVTGINRRWNWWDATPGRKVFVTRRLLGARADDFLNVQYVVIARPS